MAGCAQGHPHQKQRNVKLAVVYFGDSLEPACHPLRQIGLYHAIVCYKRPIGKLFKMEDCGL